MAVNIKHEISLTLRGGASDVTLDDVEEFVRVAREAGTPGSQVLQVRIANSYIDPRPGESSPGSATIVANP